MDKQLWMPVSGALFGAELLAVSLVSTGTHPAYALLIANILPVAVYAMLRARTRREH